MVARLISTVIAAAALAAVAAGNAGATGITGTYATGSAYCWDSNRILVTPPVISPAANAPYSMVGGGQDVGYQAVLQRWANGRWNDVGPSHLYTRFAGYTYFGDELWLDTTTRTTTAGFYFVMTGLRGHFRVLYRLYWYVNGNVSGSLTALAWGHFDVRESTFGVPGATSYDWCLY
jgi:hypothetical protein